MSKNTNAPSRDNIPTLQSLGMDLQPDTLAFVQDPQALANAIGGHGLKDIFGNWLVLLAAFSACMGGLLFGFDQGILSIVYIMPQFLSEFPEVDETVTSGAGLKKGIMTGLLELGCVLGAAASGFLADKYSRKGCLGIGSVFFVVGSVIQAASQNYAMLVVGRFIGGIGVGLLSSTAPMYISEISPPNVRGAFLALEGSAIVVGIVIMFYITVGTRHIASQWAFRLPFTLQIAPVIALGLGLWSLPYSPRWLVQVGRDAEALSALTRLRRLPLTDPRIQAEWITIRAEAIRSREVVVMKHPSLQDGSFGSDLKLETVAWVDMFSPGIIRRTMIGVMLMFFQQFLGINALIYYSPTLFGQLGLDTEMQITMSGVLNVIQMVAACSTIFMLDRVGRKPPLIVGAIGITISHFVVAGVIAKYAGQWDKHPAAAWTGVAFILFFMFCFGLGWGPVPWAMPAEVHSSSRRAKGVAITTVTNWFGNFIIGLITPPMIQGAKYGTFIFFGIFGVLALLWTIFLCPETKGKTLEQLDVIFGHATAGEEAQAHADIVALICGSSPSQSVEDVDSKEGDGKATIQQFEVA